MLYKSIKFTTIIQLSWLLVICAQNVYYLFVARVLHGMITGSVLVVAPVFLQEISTDRYESSKDKILEYMCFNAHYV